jgi:hypothetical protein
MIDDDRIGPNKYIKRIEDKIEELARKHRENGKTRIKMRTTKLPSLLDIKTNTLRNNGYPHKLDRIYDTIEYVEYQGLFIHDVDEYIEEREKIVEKRQRRHKNKRKKDIRENTENVSEVLE